MDATTTATDLIPTSEIQSVEVKAREIAEELEVLKKKAASLAESAMEVVERAKGMAVDDYGQYEAAGKLLRDIRTSTKLAEERVGPLVKIAHSAHKAAKSIENAFVKPLNALSEVLKLKMRALIMREDIRGNDPLAEVELDGEKLAEAYALAELGKQEEAEALLAEAGVFCPEDLPDGLPKVDGVSIRTLWSYKIVDEKKIPRDYMTPDLKAIGGTVRALKAKTKIKGISVYSVPSLAVTAK
ncbi:hypothetical protein LCGC14_2097270 [marine sediment metagenome]|uniref:Uncharacterized protein n=1 Tax=marine sediment metagenome TaxID=412755 RepID=A0A0F9EAV7_9ZZZZ